MLFLLYAETLTEESLLHRWVASPERAGTAYIQAGRGELAERIAGIGQGDLEMAPVRVAWLGPARRGRDAARLCDLLLLHDVRRPRAAAQERIARRSPERYRVVTGEPARLSDLRHRFASRVGEEFSTFIERQGVLALERAERDIVGQRHKVPRLVREEVMASQSFHSPESVSLKLFKGALRLAANRGLIKPGGDETQARRERLADQIRDVVRRARVIRALARDECGRPSE